MPKLSAQICVADILDELELDRLPEDSLYTRASFVTFDVEFTQDEIDEEASEQDPEIIPIDARDLRDALKSLVAGDYAMAGILLDRAFDGHFARDDDARRVVEEEKRLAISASRRAA